MWKAAHLFIKGLCVLTFGWLLIWVRSYLPCKSGFFKAVLLVVCFPFWYGVSGTDDFLLVFYFFPCIKWYFWWYYSLHLGFEHGLFGEFSYNDLFCLILLF